MRIFTEFQDAMHESPEFYASTFEGYIQILPADEETDDFLIMEVVSPHGTSVTELTEGHLLMLADWLDGGSPNDDDYDLTPTHEETT